MVDRSIFLSLAAVLRADHDFADSSEHLHSVLSERLRRAFLDHEYRFRLGIARLEAWASIHSNSQFDGEDAKKGMQQLYNSVRGMVPYLALEAGGIGTDREQAIAKHRAYLKSCGIDTEAGIHG